ncbi:MAG TPA: trypsin-like peptidase domain-containing protein [Thermoleophilaceae bacterium]
MFRSIHLRLSAAAVTALVVAAAGCGGGGDKSGATVTVSTKPAVQASPSAATLQRQFVQVVKTVSPAVVQVQTSSGLGSGVVLDGQGHIVTNAHVVGNFKEFKVTLANGSQHKASLVGTYPPNDIAVVRLDGARPHPASFADSSNIKVGDFAFAIGNPLGLRSSVTEGIVSSVGRTVSEGNGAVIPSAIQTSAPINPGNSGGALVDITGRVMGIPTLAATDPEFGGAQAPGIGFAIPSNTARTLAAKLITSGHVPQAQRAFLGIKAATIVGGGVLVEGVQKNGPADRAGVPPGDVIVAVAGKPTPTTEALQMVLTGLKPGKSVQVKVLRRTGQRTTLSVKLGTAPGG